MNPRGKNITEGGWLEKLQYSLALDIVPYSTSTHGCHCGPCFPYGWTQKNMKGSFTVALMAGCQGQAFLVRHGES
jgi:hypothetical protein